MPSLLHNFEYDIFISYRHNDNRSGWVTDFVNALQEELAATIKEPLSIYFDKNPHDGLLENHNVDKSLEGKLKCLIFIPIISQTYCDPKSFAWQHEFCAFNKLAQADQQGRDIKLSNGNVTSRILPVKIHDLDGEDQSTIEIEISGVLRAIEFIYTEPGVNRPLISTDDKKDNQNKTGYRNQVNKVANSIKDIIYALKHQPSNSVPGESQNQRSTISERKKGLRKVNYLRIATVFILIVAGLCWYYNKRNGGALEVLDKSIAVLPFVDMSPDKDQAYFCDGISEELINALVKIPELKVSGRTSSFSFKDKNTTLKQIGQELGVNTILEGSIRKSGNKLRITAQLVNAENGFHLWSETYDRELNNIFEVQDDITAAIVNSLNLLLQTNSGKPLKVETANLDAYELYLNARQLMALRGARLKEAKELFEKAIALDPDYSPAYSGLGRTLALWFLYLNPSPEENIQNWTKAKQYAKKAIALDSTNAEAFSVLGSVANFYDWDWETANTNFQKSVELAPNDAMIINMLGDYYRTINHPRLIKTEQRALELDPLQFFNHTDLVAAYAEEKDWPNVILYAQKAVKMNSLVNYKANLLTVKYFLTLAYLKLNKLEEASKLAENESEEFELFVDTYVAIAENKTDEGRRLTELIDSHDRFGSVLCFLSLGIWDEALLRLDEAFVERNPKMILRINEFEEYQEQEELSSFMNKQEIKKLLEIRKSNRELQVE